MAHIFLTGGIGEIGREILPRILRELPGADATVLVRGRDREHAAARLEEALSSVRRRWPGLDPSRVRPLRGDLEAPRLGLEAGEFRGLARRTTHVVHCAASIRLDLPLACSQAVNVGGTLAVLELAERCPRLRRFAHLSTAFVAGDRLGVILEGELDRGQGFHNAYERSKLEAETAVRSRAGRIPVTVFRPGIVVGDSRDGRTAAFTTIYLPLRIIARGRLRSIPGEGATPLDLVPVDFVAEAVARLTTDPRTAGRTFHVTAGRENRVAVRRLLETAIRIAGDGETENLRFLGVDARRRGRMECYFAHLDGERCFDDADLLRHLDPSLLPRRDPETFLRPMFEFCARTGWGARRPRRDAVRAMEVTP